MNLETKEHPATEWNYRYKDTVVIRIRHWSGLDLNGGRHPCWNYYVGFAENACPEGFEELYKLAVDEQYYDEAFTPNTVKWHDGITYSVGKTYRGTRIIECGCDYQHYWDEGRNYDIDYVSAEAESTADKLINLLKLGSPNK